MGTAILARTQLCRMIQIILAVRSGLAPNARMLAEACEVSRRTVYRDLETLEAAGFGVKYDSERQGYVLTEGSQFQPPGLGEDEVAALVVLTARSAGLDRLGLRGHAVAAVIKLVESMTDAGRQRLIALAEGVGLFDASTRRKPVTSAAPAILNALGRKRRLRLEVRNGDSGGTRTIEMSLYRLTCARGSWWLVGRVSVHGRSAAVALDEVVRADVLDQATEIPPRFRLGRGLARAIARSAQLRTARPSASAFEASKPGPRLTERSAPLE